MISNPIVGDALALLSAIFYAFYVTLLKVRIRNESRIDMQLFFGFLGLFNIITCWPIGILLHFIGAEIFEMPRSRSVVAVILINVSLGNFTSACFIERPADGDYPVERLHLCAFDAQDDATGGYCWLESDYTTRRRWGLHAREVSSRPGDTWCHSGFDQLCRCRRGERKASGRRRWQ
jgi:hypothetical protein